MDDQDLERAIDYVGRDKVFAYVRAMGWPGGTPIPKSLWWQAVAGVDERSQLEQQIQGYP